MPSETSPTTPDRLGADTLIEVDHVTFGYEPGKTVLRDISMRFARGEVTAILGGSGCGKTTVLRLIGGVYPAGQGSVRVDAQAIDTHNAEQLFSLRRRLGMLFQFGALFTDLSVFENVAFPLREHTDLDDTMIRDIVLMKLNAVGLRGAAQLRIAEISGGMARRVALARAIALDPEILLYDEPFTGLDPIAMGVAANLIRKLNDATGATSLVVSHDVQECFAICDYAYIMAAPGIVIAHGRPETLTASEDPRVRQFIRGEPDGPVPFHYPAPPLAQDLGLRAGA
ncbi:MAG TPA: ABC transporter ATP-binding protein [Burkholderiaceae bacterium]|nr:ABC transporter ATP-binding protein [Burkholderiaceae bacterium]